MREVIVIVDYGMGNLRSVWKALEKAGGQVKVSDKAEDLKEARGVVLPGVGAFSPAISNLRQRGLLEPVREILSSSVKPFLGICLGLQLLMEESEEEGPVQGLGIIPGRCTRFQTKLKVPHMGWNQVRWEKPAAIFDGIPDGSYFYFVHSYYVKPEETEWISGSTVYDQVFTSAIAKDNRIFAVQFHPEKSQQKGLKILENFVGLVNRS
jgi:glutamine amidotransferase